MSCYALLICTFIVLLPSGYGNPVLYHYTREQTTCPWQWLREDAIPTPTWPDVVTWIVAPTTPTGFMTSDIPETKKTPYTINDEWFVFVAPVWTIVELTVPPPTQDAGDVTSSKAMKPEETEALHITSAVKSIDSQVAKRQTEGMSTEKNKENRQVDSTEAKSSCEYHFLSRVLPRFQLNPLWMPLGCLI